MSNPLMHPGSAIDCPWEFPDLLRADRRGEKAMHLDDAGIGSMYILSIVIVG